MPTAMQIVNGVQADLKVSVSYRTAERALQTIRERDVPLRAA